MGTATTRTEPWDEQIPYLTHGFSGAEKLISEGMPDYYGETWKDTLAGFDPEQLASQDAMLNYIRSPEVAAYQQATGQQYLDTYGLSRNMAQGAFTPGQQAGLLAGQVNTQPFGQVVRDMSQDVLGALQSEILPGIRQSQVQYQPGGSSRGDIVASNAVSTAIDRLTKQGTQMYADEFTRAQERRLPAAQYATGAQQAAGQLGLQNMGQYQNLLSAPIGLMQIGANVGAQRRAMDQAVYNENMKRYNYESMRPYTELQNYMGMISGDYGGTSTESPSALSTMGTVLGLVKMMSDRRVKENITQVGFFKSLPVYIFNYIWSPQKHIGFIAQEVEKVIPEAVGDIFGIKTVDYPLVLREL